MTVSSEIVILNIEGECIRQNWMLVMRKCMSVQCLANIGHYEADIMLSEDFYVARKKRQSLQPTEQQKIDELVSKVC